MIRATTTSQVPVGSADIFFQTNVGLTTRHPTTFTNEQIVRLGRAHGLIPIIESGEGYSGAAFFVSFRKP